MIEQLNFFDFQVIANFKELGNYSKVAEKLHLTQPAVTHRIKQIELQVGKKVLVKSGKRYLLTEVGETLFSYYQKFKSVYEELNDEINDLEKNLHGTLTIGTSDTLGIHFLPHYLKKFRQLYPKVKLNLTSKPSRVISQEMLEGKIDLGVALVSGLNEKFNVRPLFRRKDVVIVSTKSPISKKRRVGLEDLKNMPFITLDKMSQSRFFITDWFKKAGIDIKIAMELGSIEMVKKYVATDFGFSIVPKISIEEETKAGKLMPINISDKVNFQKVAAFTVKDRYESVLAKAFIEFLLNSITKQLKAF
jgi:DNA-binding transcriptional LysR family regulator